ncbi:hypothetical protein LNAOJCKE_2831 [Methylorubrum aminovorans]|uniref:Uncharacterized protein n=1 Tax=Methylorubrum aminovorans TaxID=269069 RepID=A0ABQ4UE67_9HYPH|nr:hypothetical protein [Methylorubrum aminovorans]GJE65620.1 hypothetical protein LNAOJCKE_2831 [Methylorubrum aminovorans]
MRRFLTGGIKAILAIAVLSTAAHWAMRVQRDPASPALPVAALADPVTTGSISSQKSERPAVQAAVVPGSLGGGLDQDHLAKLMAGAASDRPKLQKAVAKR